VTYLLATTALSDSFQPGPNAGLAAWTQSQPSSLPAYERDFADSPIAAPALVHKLTVVTRNTRDLERCGVAVLNPWNG
jgi:predicted nucleic acid-binding protein